MPMLTTLNYPNSLPRWATDASRTLEPASGVKDVGWQVDDVPPARWMNWIHNVTYEWIQKITATQLMNWNQNTDISAVSVNAASYHPDQGYWMAYRSTGQTVNKSVDGHAWTAVTALAQTARTGTAAIDGSYYMVGTVLNDIEYSNDAGATWNVISSATIGGSGEIRSIHTKYPDSDYAVVARGAASSVFIRIASSGITGSWASATTHPPSVPTNAFARNLIYCGATTWVLLVCNLGAGDKTKLYKSTDDADTWTAVSGLSFSASAYGAAALAYSRETERLVVCGSAQTSGNEEYIAYSDDLGDSWTSATIDKNGIALSEVVQQVYYCGGNTWVATSREFDLATSQTIFVSTDNAVTWKVADVNGSTVTGGPTIYNGPQIVCDGKQVMVLGAAGFNATSFAG